MVFAVGISSRSSSSRFGPQLRVQVGHARDIAARSDKAGDKSGRDWVSSHLEYDRNRTGRCFRRQCRRGANKHSNHAHLAANQIGRQCGQSIILAARPAVFAPRHSRRRSGHGGNACNALAYRSGAALPRNPITAIAGCCARAPSGHVAAAPPTSVMNSRRFIRDLPPKTGNRIGKN